MCPVAVSIAGGAFIDFRAFGGLDLDFSGLLAIFANFPSLASLNIDLTFDLGLVFRTSLSQTVYFANTLLPSDITAITAAIQTSLATWNDVYGNVLMFSSNSCLYS